MKCIALEKPKLKGDILHLQHLHRIDADVLNVFVRLSAESLQAWDVSRLNVTQASEWANQTQREHGPLSWVHGERNSG